MTKKGDKKDDKKAPRGRGDRGRGDRGRGDDDGRGFGRRGRRGGRRGRRGQPAGGEKKEWVPTTKLGRLVKDKKIISIEETFLFSMKIKEYQIVDAFLGETLKDEVMKIHPVQKQSAAGQRTRFKAYAIVGDSNGHIGLGVKCSKEVSLAIRAAIILAKLAVIPVRRGYWGGRFAEPHTLPCKVTGKCGSVRFRLIPAPRGTGLVAARVPKKVLEFAGVKDCYTSSRGQTKTQGNSLKATYHAIVKTYAYLTPDLWKPTEFSQTPFQKFTDYLKENPKPKKFENAPSA